MSKIAVVVDMPLVEADDFANIAQQLSVAIGAGRVNNGAVQVRSMTEDVNAREVEVTVVIRCPVIPEEMARLVDHVV